MANEPDGAGPAGSPAPESGAYEEAMFAAWLDDPESVPPDWRDHFRRATRPGVDRAAAPRWTAAPESPVGGGCLAALGDGILCGKHMRVLGLIDAYRQRGHLGATLDPLGIDVSHRWGVPTLAEFDLSESDMKTRFVPGSFAPGQALTLDEIVERLGRIYCGSIGIEYTHIQDPEPREWLRREMESPGPSSSLTVEDEEKALRSLIAAETLEQFLHRKFPGTKRFSLEGSESLIPALGGLIEWAVAAGVRHLVLGMAHRGRLNVLSNVLRKPYTQIFAEFEDVPHPELSHGSGDVKYHLGFDTRVTLAGQEVVLSLTPNPSHLEAVDGVVEGRARALQDQAGPEGVAAVLPVVIHGDAAFAGQGVVAETLNMADLEGYTTGGTIHLVVNNQIGFTTTRADARSSLYATDVARMVAVPIFHVNGHDVHAVLKVVRLAVGFRSRFRRDCVIDLVGYRKYGHNETDEPSFTQPAMYRRIQAHPGVRRIFTGVLVESGRVTRASVDEWEAAAKACLDGSLAQGRAQRERRADHVGRGRSGLAPAGEQQSEEPTTAVDRATLRQIARGLVTVPERFHPHPKMRRLLDERARMGMGEAPLDWAMAEAMAFGTLVAQGIPVRLSGQDSRRGTFSQRHAVLTDVQTQERWTPLACLREGQAPFFVFDSSLSEASVLGFEYGYSLESRGLILWEAQFGDFANGAQVIIDHFIVSGQTKWGRPSGLVLLVPHGYEGQGPEHSSARVERYLAACAEENLRVVNATTPAQYFHLLRRQALGNQARPLPLIVFTPKSLLRHKGAVSDVGDLEAGRFLEVIPEPAPADPEAISRVLLCSGKIYYDLVKERGERTDVAIARLEELYPFPRKRLDEILGQYRPATSVCWVQEEPRNMGPWPFVHAALEERPGRPIAVTYVGRPAAASPATGSAARHKEEQQRIVEEALSRDTRRQRPGAESTNG
ncbi:MAG: 2-oxoglutarate dehydrogenase E1 component [Candidatus Riflebacteria bacterium]|nr:2-oxoglutarate dehydrogenase E1 component [Candidatus Riflebacteria bacterium]